MRFRPWGPQGSDKIIRIYVDGMEGVSIGKARGSKTFEVMKANPRQKEDVINFLSGVGINLGHMFSTEMLINELSKCNLLTNSSSRGRSVRSRVDSVDLGNLGRPGYQESEFKSQGIESLSRSASAYDISKIQILKRTIRNLVIEVDHREPESIVRALKETGANVIVKELKEGDFRLYLNNDDSREMLFERKTITDLAVSITDQYECRAHSQAERYSLYREHRKSEECYVGVFWIYEYEEGKTLYNTLNTTQAMDGWLNYVQAINGHQVIHSFNKHHTACLIFKFAQGFFEQELRRKVVKGLSQSRVDRTKTEREHVSFQMGENTGVSRAEDGVAGMLAAMPGISIKVAESLASTGKSFREITQMSVNEMLVLNGIGEKTAIHIYELFGS